MPSKILRAQINAVNRHRDVLLPQSNASALSAPSGVPPDFIDHKEKGISNQSDGEIDENGVFHFFPHELVRGLAYPPPPLPTYANKI